MAHRPGRAAPPVHACIESLRDASHGLLIYTDTYRCFIGIHYLSTAAISPLRWNAAPDIGTGFGLGPGDKPGKKGKESHKASQSRSPLERSNVQIQPRFRPCFLASSMILTSRFFLLLYYFIFSGSVASQDRLIICMEHCLRLNDACGTGVGIPETARKLVLYISRCRGNWFSVVILFGPFRYFQWKIQRK